MSQIIDSKVVEMRFDNKEFEANARNTINTLENLKRALNDNLSGEAFENLDRAARNVDLSSIEKSLDVLTDRFSTMGIVGMRVIQNLTDGLMNLVHRGINYASDAIVSGGMKRAQNIENARFQLEGLLDDEAKVQQIMSDALDSVDGTAYAYDEAAKAASMFAASGVEAGEQMQGALKAIAGVAATTNSNYEDMANIFTTVAGQGKIMTQQLRQLESRGMNAAASLADYFNKVRDNQVEASDAVRSLVAQLSGSEAAVQGTASAISQASNDIIEAQQKANNQEYKAKQKAYNTEYKELKDTLDAEYNLKKKEYDAAYQELSKSLDAEIQAVQKANNQRLQDANLSYQQEVEAYRAATNERINLINEEYTESIKLIDEERYEKIKAAQEKIDAINAEAEAEAKAKKDSANAEKKAEIEKLLANAKSNTAKKKAAEVLAEFEAQLAEEQKAEDRKNQIKNLQEEINNINDEANEKKKAAAEKRQSEIELVQDESNEKLKEMQKAHQAEIEAIQESNTLQLEQLRENKNIKLSEMREAQALELSTLKEGQNNQLEVLKERQQQELEDFKELQNEKIKALKESSKQGIVALEDFNSELGFTEAQIREMITNGLIDFDTFSEAMGTTFGDHAKDANKTFSGAMANIRSAFAKIGALFYSPLIEEEGPLVGLLNAIRIKVNALKDEIKPFAEYITSWLNQILIPKATDFINNLDVKLDSSWQVLIGIGNIMQSIYNSIKAVGSVIGVVVDAFAEIYGFDKNSFLDLTTVLKDFTESLILSRDNSSKLAKVIKSVAKLFKSFLNIIKKTVSVFKPLSKLFGDAANSSLDLSAGFADNIDRFSEWLDKSEGINKFFETATKAMTIFVDGLIKAKNGVIDFFKSFSKEGEDSSQSLLQGFVNGITNFAKGVYDKIKEFASTILITIRQILGIESPSKETFQDGVNLIQGFIDGVSSVIQNAIEFVKDGFTRVLDTIKEVFSGFNSNDVDLDGESIGGNFITDFIAGVKDHIPSPITAMIEFFNEMKDKILQVKIGHKTGEEYLSQFLEGFKSITGKIRGKIEPIFENVTGTIHDFFTGFANSDGEETGGSYILAFLKGIKDKFLDKTAEIFGFVSQSIKEIVQEVPNLAIIAGAVAAISTLILVAKGIKAGIFAELAKGFKIIKKFKLVINGIDFLKAKENIDGLIDNISSKVSFIPENILEGFRQGLLKGNELITTVSEFFGRVLQAIKDVFGIASPAKEMISIATNLVTTFVDTIGKLIGPAAEKIGSMFGTVIEAITKVFAEGFSALDGKESSILAFVGGISALALLIKLSGKIDTIVGPFHRVNGVLLSLKNALKAFAFDTYAEGILKIAGAFALFFGSMATFIWVIDKLENGDRLAASLIAIFFALATFVTTAKLVIDAVSKIKEKNLSIFSDNPKDNFFIYIGQGIKKAISQWTFAHTMKAFASSVLMIATSFVGVIVTIVKYKKENEEGLKEAYKFFAIMLAIIAGMGAIGLLVTELAAKEEVDLANGSAAVMKFALAVLAIAGTITLIVHSLKKIMELDLDSDKFKEAKKAILLMLAAVGGLIAAYIWVSSKWESKAQHLSASPLIGFAVLLWATISSLKKFLTLKINIKRDGGKLIAFGGILVILSAIIAIFMAVSKEGEGVVTGGGAILAMCVWLYAAIGAIALLSKFKVSDLIKGIVSIIFLCFAMAIVLSEATKDTSGSFKTVLAMCAALATCLVALGVFTTFDTKDLWLKGVLPIVVILLCIAGCFVALGSIDTGVGANKAWSMVVALGVIVGGLALMTNDVFGAGPKKLLSGAVSIAVVLGAYAATMGWIAKKKINSTSLKTFYKGLGLLGAIVAAIFILTNKWTGGSWGSLLSAGAAISACIWSYGIVFANIAKVTVDEYTIKQFLLGSLSLIVIGGALAAVAWADWSSILAAGASIAGVIEAYGHVFRLLEGVAVSEQCIHMFLLGAVSLIMIGGALAATAWADWESILAAGGSIAGVIEAYGHVFRTLEGVTVDKDAVWQFLKGSLSILLIGAVIGTVAHFADWEEIAASAGGIALVLSKYRDVFEELNGVEISTKNIGKFLLGCVSIAIIGAVIAGTIGLTKLWGGDTDWKTMAATAGGIAVCLLAVGKVMQWLANADFGKFDVLATIGALLAGCVGAIIIANALNEIKSTEGLVQKALGIAIVLGAVAVVMAVCALIGNMIVGTGFWGALGMEAVMFMIDQFIAQTAAVCGAIIGLASLFPEGSIEKGKENMINIGKGIGGFFGGIVEGFLDISGQGIAELGNDLAEFMKNAQPFFDGLEQFDESMQQKAEAFANVALALSGTSFVNALADLINAINPFSKGMKEKFSEFGASIAAFAEETQGINGWNTKNAAEACKYLAQALNKLNPVKDFFTSFELDSLGERFKKMGKAVSGVLGADGFNGVPNPENYKNVSDSVLALTALFDPKNPNGHLASRDFNDVEDLPELGENLKKFAVSVSVIGGYAKYFEDITPFENLVTIGQKLLPLCTTKGYMATNDSLLGIAWGTNDPASLGHNLINFARFMVGTSINDVSCLFGVLSKGWPMNEAMIDMLATCAEKLFKVADAVPVNNEGLQWFLNGNNDIKDFGERMLDFADKMIELQGKLKEKSLVSTDFINFKSAVGVLFEMTETLKGLYLTDDNEVIDMGENIKTFGEAFEDFGENIKSFGKDANKGYVGFDGAVELLERFVKLIPSLMSFDGTTVSNFFKEIKQNAKSGLKEFLDEFENSKEPVTKAIATMFSFIGEAIQSKKILMESYGRITVNYFTGSDGLTSQSSLDSVKSAMSRLISNMSIDYEKMKTLGVNAARGFANGLVSNDAMGDVQRAAQTFGSRVYSEIAHTLAINSPSRKTAELGLFTAEGFINGLLSLAKAAGEAGSEVGDSAADGLKMALEKISSNIQNDEQFNPVITPVLDLSNIEENAGAIGGILNLDKPIGLAANAGMSFTGGLNSLLGSIQASIPDGSNGDVVTAINEMRADMAEMSAAIRQMQIVMDTGELVGAITDPIDHQLGFNQILIERGVR